jgi:hypothetical protein
VRGEWWRLLTCAFVHIGIIHLLMNLAALRVVGADVEWLWGPGRYLVIYLLSALGGSCMGLAAAPALAGASGALCGLVAAEAAWLVLNRRHLPGKLVRAQLGILLLNGVLITLISLLPGVSGAGHLGGALAGAAAAVLLHYQRFGGRVLRGAAAAGLLALPVACVVGLKGVSDREANWHAAPRVAQEKQRLLDPAEELDRLAGLDKALQKFHDEILDDVLAPAAKERKPREVRQALAELPEHLRRFRDATSRLEALGKQTNELLERERQAGLNYFRKQAMLLENIRHSLERATDWDEADPAALEVDRARIRWLDVRTGN